MTRSGGLLVSCGKTAQLYHINPRTSETRALTVSNYEFKALAGIALSPDERSLFVCDLRRCVCRVQLPPLDQQLCSESSTQVENSCP
jgi:sugar lactone lactonase YvrE